MVQWNMRMDMVMDCVSGAASSGAIIVVQNMCAQSELLAFEWPLAVERTAYAMQAPRRATREGSRVAIFSASVETSKCIQRGSGSDMRQFVCDPSADVRDACM